MNPVESLHECTHRLYNHLSEGLPKTDRDPYIDKIQKLLEERQHWIEELPPAGKGIDDRFSRELIEYEKAIQRMIGKIFDEVSEDLHHVRRRKTTSERYTHPYQGGAADGMFLDKRK